MVFVFVVDRTHRDAAARADRHAHARDRGLGQHLGARLRRRRAVCGDDACDFARVDLVSRAPLRRRRLFRPGPDDGGRAHLGIDQVVRRNADPARLDLVAPSGALLAILGASGSGKTTLLRLIARLRARRCRRHRDRRPDRLRARRPHASGEAAKSAMSRRKARSFPHLSVAENVVFGLPRAERRDGAGRRRCSRASACPRPTRAARPHELSGGEQQRVALARALAPAPKFCCSTSRSPPSTPRCGSRPARRWRRSWRPPARPRCLSRMTSPRRSRWGARSPCCGTGRSRRSRRRKCSIASRPTPRSRNSSAKRCCCRGRSPDAS